MLPFYIHFRHHSSPILIYLYIYPKWSFNSPQNFVVGVYVNTEKAMRWHNKTYILFVFNFSLINLQNRCSQNSIQFKRPSYNNFHSSTGQHLWCTNDSHMHSIHNNNFKILIKQSIYLTTSSGSYILHNHWAYSPRLTDSTYEWDIALLSHHRTLHPGHLPHHFKFWISPWYQHGCIFLRHRK